MDTIERMRHSSMGQNADQVPLTLVNVGTRWGQDDAGPDEDEDDDDDDEEPVFRHNATGPSATTGPPRSRAEIKAAAASHPTKKPSRKAASPAPGAVRKEAAPAAGAARGAPPAAARKPKPRPR